MSNFKRQPVSTGIGAPDCPSCGSAMVRKPVRRGPRAGLEMWGCSRWPECNGAINIDETGADHEAEPDEIRPGVAGGYAQHRWERERSRDRTLKRAALPLLTAIAIVAMAMGASALSSIGPVAMSLGAVATGVAVLYAFTRLPFDSLFWLKGAEGERKTAAFLEPLLPHGFVVLHDRLIPGVRGNLDHLAIGPTGVFAIETKNWGGRIDVKGGQLFVGDHDRSWVLDQVHREAMAVQIALADEMNAHALTVSPILVIHGARVPRFQREAAGVHLVAGPKLAPHLLSRPARLDSDLVLRLARLADRALREPPPWELPGL